MSTTDNPDVNNNSSNSNQNTNLIIDFLLNPGEETIIEEEEYFWLTQEKLFDLMDELQDRIQYVCEDKVSGETIKVLFYKRENNIFSIYLKGLPEAVADIQQKFQAKTLTQFKERKILQIRPVTAAAEEKTIRLIHEIESSKAYLSGVNLSSAYIRGTNLSKANLQETNLSNAYIRGTNMRKANLQEANFSESKITWCDFRKANLKNTVLSETELYGNDFRHANLSEADLSGACIRTVEIPFIPMFVIWHSTFKNANLKGAILNKINFQDINLRGADLRDANLQECNMHKADLTGANLAGADLRGANFERAKVLKAYFGANKGMDDKLKNTLIANGAIFIAS